MKTALRVLNDLVAEKVIKDYAIGGAMGAMFYMEAVTTMDLDVFVVFNDDLNLLPLQPIYDALKAKGYHPDEYLAAICVQTGRMKDRLRVQMFLSSDGFDKKKFEGLLDKFGMSKEKSQWMQ